MGMTANRIIPLTDRGVLAIHGPETRSFLQGIITNDIAKVDRTRSIYAALLTPQGKFLFDFILHDDGGDGVLLEAQADRLGDLARRLTMYKLRSKAVIEDVSASMAVTALIGGDGPAAAKLYPGAGNAWRNGDTVACIDPRLAALGVRIVHPAATPLARDGFAPGTLEDYQAHRLALAVPEGGSDVLVEKSFILESNFEELNAVDFNKGCYVGQELTARTKFRGTIRRRLFGVTAEGALPPPGTPITAGSAEIGEMRSARDGIGIALIRTDRLEEAGADTPLHAGDVTITAHKPAWAAF